MAGWPAVNIYCSINAMSDSQSFLLTGVKFGHIITHNQQACLCRPLTNLRLCPALPAFQTKSRGLLICQTHEAHPLIKGGSATSVCTGDFQIETALRWSSFSCSTTESCFLLLQQVLPVYCIVKSVNYIRNSVSAASAAQLTHRLWLIADLTQSS